jgi:hypothetical protein
MIITDFSQIAIATIYADTTAHQCACNPSKESKDVLHHIILNSLRANNREHRVNYGKMVLAIDSKSWRYDIFPEYKYSRKNKKEKEDIDWNFVNECISDVVSICQEYMHYPVIKVEGAEADDIIGVLTKHISTTTGVMNMFDELEPENILIISSDKDNYQLHRYDNVRQFSPAIKKQVKPEFGARKALIEKIVKGDSGDGIPSIKSPANFFATKEAGARQKSISAKYLQSFFDAKNPIDACEDEEQRKNYIRNETLVSYEKIPDVVANRILECYNAQLDKKGSKMGLLKYFASRRFSNLSGSLEDFF